MNWNSYFYILIVIFSIGALAYVDEAPHVRGDILHPHHQSRYLDIFEVSW